MVSSLNRMRSLVTSVSSSLIQRLLHTCGQGSNNFSRKNYIKCYWNVYFVFSSYAGPTCLVAVMPLKKVLTSLL